MRERLATTGGVLAVTRLAAVPIFFAAERLVGHPVENTAPFGVLLAIAGFYAVAAFAAELRGRPLARSSRLAVVDLVLISLLVATSGGPFSQVRYAFFILPIGAALLLRPQATAVTSAAIVAAYALIAVTYPDPERVREDAGGFEITQLVFLAWMGAAATALSGLLARDAREIAGLAESRGRLVAQALDAEDGARRRLAEALHDEALQALLAARQEIGAGPDADLAFVTEALDETSRQLREMVFDLHPYQLEQAGLEAALRAVAERAARRAGLEARVDTDGSDGGAQRALVFSIARELIANVAKHSGASRMSVDVRRSDGELVLCVTDDGTGIDRNAAALAPRRGHIGLASSAERAEALGGELSLHDGPGGRGTLVRVRLPDPVPA